MLGAMPRAALLAVVLVLAGCTTRADRATLPGLAMRDQAVTGGSVPLERRWRFAGTRGGEHIVVHAFGVLDGERTRRYALPERDYVMPAAMSYTSDDSRWIPLKEIHRIRADGSTDLDFARLSANEIDAWHGDALSPAMLKVGL